jgi:hypothetical protein
MPPILGPALSSSSKSHCPAGARASRAHKLALVTRASLALWVCSTEGMARHTVEVRAALGSCPHLHRQEDTRWKSELLLAHACTYMAREAGTGAPGTAPSLGHIASAREAGTGAPATAPSPGTLPWQERLSTGVYASLHLH